jgi:hypothetical protein
LASLWGVRSFPSDAESLVSREPAHPSGLVATSTCPAVAIYACGQEATGCRSQRHDLRMRAYTVLRHWLPCSFGAPGAERTTTRVAAGGRSGSSKPRSVAVGNRRVFPRRFVLDLGTPYTLGCLTTFIKPRDGCDGHRGEVGERAVEMGTRFRYAGRRRDVLGALAPSRATGNGARARAGTKGPDPATARRRRSYFGWSRQPSSRVRGAKHPAHSRPR